MPETLKELRIMLTPSWLSGLLSVASGIIVIGVESLVVHLKGSSLEQLILAIHSVGGIAAGSYQSITSNLDNIAVINDLPLFILWAGVGSIVYVFAVKVYRGFTSVADTEERMHYVHANSKAVLKEALTHLAVRLLALAILIAMVLAFIHIALPYSLMLAIRFGQNLSLQNMLYALLGVFIVAACLSLMVSDLRLLALRLRLVGESEEELIEN